MKKLQNNFTTPEQSKRLLELGVPANSADCYLDVTNGRRGMLAINGIYGMDVPNILCEDGSQRFIPCWSVGRLIEIAFICFVCKVSAIIFWWMGSPMDNILYEFENNKMDFSKLEE